MFANITTDSGYDGCKVIKQKIFANPQNYLHRKRIRRLYLFQIKNQYLLSAIRINFLNYLASIHIYILVCMIYINNLQKRCILKQRLV